MLVIVILTVVQMEK